MPCDLRKHTYSRKVEYYAYLRMKKTTTREHYLFWLNVHYAEQLLSIGLDWGG